MVYGYDPVLVPHDLPALGAGAEVVSGPPAAVLPLGQAEPAVGVAAVEGDGTDEDIKAGWTLILPLKALCKPSQDIGLKLFTLSDNFYFIFQRCSFITAFILMKLDDLLHAYQATYCIFEMRFC